MKSPPTERSGFLTTQLDDEVVVYDPATKQAHSLNRVAVSVWTQADSATTIDELQQKVADELGMPVRREAVALALRKLEQAKLVLNKAPKGKPLSRREVLRKAGRYGAVAVAVTPIIASALVPVAAAAASICVGPFSPGSTSGATCGSSCQCLKTMTPNGPGSPRCVDYTALRGTMCGPKPSGYVGCNPGDVCVQVDSSANLGLCYGACSTPTCTC